jgi:hypothetical protein
MRGHHRQDPRAARRTGPGARPATIGVALVALVGAAVRPAAAAPPPSPETRPVWFAPGLAPAPPGGAPLLAVFSLPPQWASGDAVAVLLDGGACGPGARGRLVTALIEEEAGVLEVETAPAPPVPSGNDGAAPLVLLFGALRALRRDEGAGPVALAIGCGAAADAALAAAEEAVAAAHLGADGPRFAAAIGIGPEGCGIRFAAGAPPPLAERWPARAPLLCVALATVVTGDAPAGAGCADVLLGGAGHGGPGRRQ